MILWKKGYRYLAQTGLGTWSSSQLVSEQYTCQEYRQLCLEKLGEEINESGTLPPWTESEVKYQQFKNDRNNALQKKIQKSKII
jgi:hypothetical protein